MARISAENTPYNPTVLVGYLENIEDSEELFALFKESAKEPLLSAEEEATLFRIIQIGLMAQQRLKTKKRIRPEDRATLNDLVAQGKAAEDRVVNGNLRLVYSYAKRYQYRGLSFLDLAQEGSIGLLIAARRFDPNRGLKFSTYATYWIKQSLGRAVENQGRVIRLPVHIGLLLSRIYKYANEFRKTEGRVPTLGELSKRFNVALSTIENLSVVAQPNLSLDTQSKDKSDSLLIDLLPDDHFENQEDQVIILELARHFDKAFQSLSDREKNIITLRYGLDGEGGKTLEEIGKKMGLSKEGVRKIEKSALACLQNDSFLKSFLDSEIE